MGLAYDVARARASALRLAGEAHTHTHVVIIITRASGRIKRQTMIATLSRRAHCKFSLSFAV
jgi:hypothetical protein